MFIIFKKDNMKNFFFKNFLIITTTISFFSCAEKKERITISLLPLGNVSVQALDSISAAIKNEYHFDVSILPEINIPEKFFVNVKSPRYRADSLIKYLRTTIPDTVDYIMGITEQDISVTKTDENGNIKNPESKYADWGVFGFGYVGNSSSIISSFRIKNTDEKIFFSRIQKIALHELGHNLGLPHCKNKMCVMCDAAETIHTIDRVNKALCENCRAKI